MILSHAFWQRRSAPTRRCSGASSRSRPSSILGARGPARVVGIMPPDFRFLDLTPQPDVILADAPRPAAPSSGNIGFSKLARLKPGVTPAEAIADVSACRDFARGVAAHGLQRDRSPEIFGSPRSFDR